MRRRQLRAVRARAVIAGKRRADRVWSAPRAIFRGRLTFFEFVGAGVELAREGVELLGHGSAMLFRDTPQAGRSFAEKLGFLA